MADAIQVFPGVIYAQGHWWHEPCARLDEFPRRGKLIPDTIITRNLRRFVCEVCGWTWEVEVTPEPELQVQGEQEKQIEFHLNQRHSIRLRPLTEDEGGGWLAEVPDWPGCASDGMTPEEALRNLEDAKRAWVSVMIERGRPVPQPRDEAAELEACLAKCRKAIQKAQNFIRTRQVCTHTRGTVDHCESCAWCDEHVGECLQNLLIDARLAIAALTRVPQPKEENQKEEHHED